MATTKTKAATAPTINTPERIRRQTTPGTYSPYTAGGLGIIPRRGNDRPDALMYGGNVQSYALRNPQRMLVILRSMHPALAKATETVLSLLSPHDGIRIVAEKESTDGAGDATTDDAGTAILDAFFTALPNEVGGVNGLMQTNLLSVLFAGMACAEGVPAESGKGLAHAWPVDSLTIEFGRDPDTSALKPYQRQTGGFTGGYKGLNPETFHWRGLATYPDEPYSDPWFVSALNECLADMRLMQALRDAFHHMAWPRAAFTFDISELIKFAMEIMHLDQEPATVWAFEQYEKFVQGAETMKADDTIFMPANGKVEVLEGGKGFGNNTAVMDAFARRLTQSLKMLPLFLGINDSTTETQAKVQFEVMVSSLENLRSVALDPIVWLANLHLRLLGLNLKARAEYGPIRTGEALVEAQTEEIELRNAAEKVRRGYITDEQASMEITGSGLADPEKAKAAGNTPQPAPQPAQGGGQMLESGMDAPTLARATSWGHVWREMGLDEAEQSRIREERRSIDVTIDNAQ